MAYVFVTFIACQRIHVVELRLCPKRVVDRDLTFGFTYQCTHIHLRTEIRLTNIV